MHDKTPRTARQWRRSALHFALPCALVSALPMLAAAQVRTELPEVVSTATRGAQNISELAATTWIIEGEELQMQIRAGVPLKEALGQLIPGLDLGPQGRTNYGQNLRGRSVLVMIDGVSLNSARGISRQFDSIDPFNIERVEVLSGASAVYGGGATGGIINLITKRGEAGGPAFTSEVGVRSGLRHSDDHDTRIAQSISGGNDVVQARLGLALQKNEAAYGGNGKPLRTDITQTDLQYNRSVDVLGSVDIKLPAGQRLSLLGQYYESKYDGDKSLYMGPNLIGALTTQSHYLEQRGGFSSDVVPTTKRGMVNADYHATNILGGQDFNAQVFARQEKISFYPFPGRIAVPGLGALPYYSSSRQNTDAIGLKTAFTKNWDRVSVTYGVDLDRETFDASQVLFDNATSLASGGLVNRAIGSVGRYPGYRIDGVSAFGQADWKLSDALTLSGGVRQQRMSVDVDDFVQTSQQVLVSSGYGRSADAIPGGSNRYNVTLLNAGATYRFAPTERAWANYSEGFELPDPAKYYGVGNYQLVGGTGGTWRLLNSINVAASPLTSIKTKQVELGWARRAGGLSMQAAAFYSWSDKNITYVPITLSLQVAEERKRNYGLEGQVAYTWAGGWQLGGNVLAIRSERRQNGDWVRQSITDASPSKLTAFAGWADDKVSARLQAVRSFSLSDSAGNQLASYTTFDLMGSYKLPVGRLSVGIQNLLDKDYQTIWSQRAQVFYRGLTNAETLDYRGRSRTLALTYTASY